MIAKKRFLGGVDQVSEGLNVERPERLDSSFQIDPARAAADGNVEQDPQRDEGNGDKSPSGDQSLSKRCSSVFHVSTSSWGTTVRDAGSSSGASKYPIQIETQTR